MNFKYAARILRRNPGFTAVAILTLALGIGANAAIFSVVQAVLLRSLPYADPARLIGIAAHNPDSGADVAMSFTKFTLLRERSQTLAGLAGYYALNMTAAFPAGPEQIRGARISASFFNVLGTHPELGRDFLPSEDQPGAPAVCLVSHTFWENRLNSDPAIPGKSITIDGRSVPVAGVLPAGFHFPFIQPDADVWMPGIFDRSDLDPVRIRTGSGYFFSIARIRPSVSLAAVQAEFDTLNLRYREANPGFLDAPLLNLHAQLLGDLLTANLRPALIALLAAVGFVLLIACANVAGLLIARASAREREIAIRRALGCSRSQLVRQLLTESLLLTFLGGALGVSGAALAVPASVSYLGPRLLPATSEISVDASVIAWSFALCCATGVLLGLIPALQISRRDLQDRLQAGARGSSGGRRGGRMREAVVVIEMATALVLIAGAGLLIRSFVSLVRVHPGFEARQVLTFPLQLPAEGYAQPAQRSEFFRQLVDRVSAVPGIQAAGVVSDLPLASPTRLIYACAEGTVCLGVGKDPLITVHRASPDYFRAMGIRLLQGRSFQNGDSAESQPVAILNQTAARRYFPGGNPLGKHIQNSRDRIPLEIVGIVGDVKFNSLTTADSPELYVPHPQMSVSSMILAVRSTVNQAAVTAAVRQALAGLDRNLPLAGIQTMEDVVSASTAAPRLVTELIGAFGAVAVLLSAIGIYGVLAYSVVRRQKELAIRLALGSSPSGVVKLVVWRGLRLAALGIGIGLAVSFGTNRLLKSLLFGTSVSDPLTLVSVSLLLMLVALAACYLPAWRATRIDAVTALRSE